MLEILLSAASTVCACVPMFAFLGAVWWLDRYDREPVWLIGLTFVWGSVGAVAVAVVASAAASTWVTVGVVLVGSSLGLDPEALARIAGPVLVAPLCEEPAKAAFLLLVIFNRHFDNMTDGFVYGAAAGLGFAMTENLLYFVSASTNVAEWGQTVVIRTLYSALMHATATSIVGASLGFARFRRWPVLVASGVVGLLVAGGVHALWNGLIAFSTLGGGGMFVLDLVLFPAEVLMVLVVFEVCVLEEAAILRRELAEEALEGRIPRGHPKILASWIRRVLPGWAPAGVDQEAYVRTATSLAFRKHQLRQHGPEGSAYHAADVERLRARLAELLGGPAPR